LRVIGYRRLMVLLDKKTIANLLTAASLHSLAIFTAAGLTKLSPLSWASDGEEGGT